jgi:S-formylglutathione hydrolase
VWTVSEIHGKSVNLFVPTTGRPIGGMIYLHDRDGVSLRDMPCAASWVESNRLAVACPHGGECWWTDRDWPPFDAQQSAECWLMNKLLPDLKVRWGDAGFALAGIGMGGQGALRIAFKHPELFPIVAAHDAAVDFHDLYYEGTALDEIYPSREHCRQDSPVLQISQLKQPRHIYFACDPESRWERGNDRLHEKLMALGVEHQFVMEKDKARPETMFHFVEQAFATEGRRLI